MDDHPNRMLDVTTAGWVATLALIGVLLALDLVVSGRRAKAVAFREATAWSIFYVAVALVFGLVFGTLAGWEFGAQYFAGYVVEKSLSVDNLFVFVVIMSTFAVPAEQQPRVLTFGIIAALVLRAIFIALGAALLALFSFMFLIFGLLLILTAVQLFRHRDQDPSIDDNPVVVAARRLLPLTDRYHGKRLLAREGERRVLTPLFLVLLAIGSTDVLFALDSIPAVFGIRRALHRLRRERLRPPRATRALLPRHRAARPAGVPLGRPRRDPRLHRSQARAALRPLAERRRTGDHHRHLARRHPRGPLRDDDREHRQGAPRPDGPRACRHAPRPSRAAAGKRRSRAAAESSRRPSARPDVTITNDFGVGHVGLRPSVTE
jgi:TerC family integral membrane protein